MARLVDVPGGEGPANDSERRVIATLLERLPDTYWIAPNVEIRDPGGQTFEYDAIIVAPHGVYVLEVKDWWGHIEGDDVEWLVNGSSRKAPLRITERKAKVLKSRLVNRTQALARVRVEAAVLLASKPSSLVLTPEGEFRVFRLDQVIGFLMDPSQIGQRPDSASDLVQHILQALTGQLRPHSSPLEFRDYQVIEQLDGNDDEALYRARHRLMPGAPAVRLRVITLSPYLLTEQQRTERRRVALRETEALLRMGSHPNVVAAREFFEDDDHIILVQDDAEGRTLRQRLSLGTPMTVQERLHLIADVCRALTHAHAHQVIHRQVEPQNIVLADDGTAQLTRFGLAKLLDGAAQTVWLDPKVADIDVRYLAPELLNPNLGGPSPATDLFELGCLAFELFNGNPPFELPAQAFDGLPPLPEATPLAFVELVAKLLVGNPMQRPSNAKEVLAAVEGMSQEDVRHQASGPKHNYAPGDLIDGKFEVRERLGGGGFSNVYRVYKALDDREYALKVFNSASSYETVRREIQVLLSLPPHPHIVRAVWADQTMAGQWYLLTELLNGESLEAYTDGRKKFSPAEAVRVMLQLLGALEAIHPVPDNDPRIAEVQAKIDSGEDITQEEYDTLQDLRSLGIVHRDIKPQNLMLTAEGVKLIDFNISSHVGQQVQTVSGTAPFMPPDMLLAGIEEWDVSPDLFATGIVLYLLLCHEHPYEDWQPQIRRLPRDPRSFRPDMVSGLAAFLVKACAPRRQERFATALEMRSALEAVDLTVPTTRPEPVAALAPRLAEMIAAAPPNVNPMVREFLMLSSQARQLNKGTRGLNDLSQATYVQTRLDEDLGKSVLAGKHRLVIVTGNAGDGKTAFIQQVEHQVKQAGAQEINRTGNGSQLKYAGLDILTLYDGSQDEEDRTSDEVLQDFLAPYAIHAEQDKAIRLAAINEGRLRDFLIVHRDKYPFLATDIIASLDDPDATPLGPEIIIVNLNQRSVTANGKESIFSRQVMRIVTGPFWQSCQTCDFRSRCPLKHNVDTFADSTSGTAVTERLRILIDLVRLRRRRHLTMRDVRSLISHLLFRDRTCEEIPALLASERPFDTLNISYFQGMGGLGVPERTALERGADLLTEIDVALVANPEDDRLLARGGGMRKMDFPTRSSDYLTELINDSRERAGKGYDSDVHLARATHEAARRQVYFERADDGWWGMLPYIRLQEFQNALHVGADDVRNRLLNEVVRAISMYEGATEISHASGALWLATSEQADLTYRCFRRFPIEDFEILVVSVSAEFIESEPDRLELRHKQTKARLDLDVDLVEILDRLQEGYMPSLDEGRGFLINLSLFKNRLLAEPSSELIIASSEHLLRIARGRQPGSVILTEMENENIPVALQK